jgi:hypothetical protein
VQAADHRHPGGHPPQGGFAALRTALGRAQGREAVRRAVAGRDAKRTMTLGSDRPDGRRGDAPDSVARACDSLPKPGLEPAGGDRREVNLLLRGIRDEFWISAIEESADDLMRRLFRGDGAARDLVRDAMVADLDKAVLSEAIGRELTSRLAREIRQHAGIDLDLRFSALEILKGGSARFLTVDIGGTAAAAIYDWNVRQAGLPAEKVPALATLGKWELGEWLDGIVRSINGPRRNGVTVYADLFHSLWIDGFLVKAMLLALKHPSMFRREMGLQDWTMH